VAEISDHLADESITIWLDLRDPGRDDLAVLSDEFGLHPLAVEDAVHEHQRPKLDRYRSHLFLTAYGARLDTGTGELATTELAAFVTGRALITVRKDDGLDIGAVTERWDASPDLAKFGVGYLLHGLLDYVVDSHFEAVQSLDMIPVSPPSLTPNSTLKCWGADAINLSRTVRNTGSRCSSDAASDRDATAAAWPEIR